MKKQLLAALCGVFVSVGAAQAQLVVRIGPPPPPRHEFVPPPPHRGWVWQPGYHRWDGRAYVWVPGAYVAPPHPYARWVPGHWGHRRGGYVWIPGHWR